MRALVCLSLLGLVGCGPIAIVLGITEASDSGSNPPPAPDLVLPSVAFSAEPGSTPDAVSSDAAPTFRFGANKANVTFAGSHNGGAFEPVTSPWTIPGPLADGEHTFTVRVTDSLGRASSSTYTWTVDTTPPTAPTGLAATALGLDTATLQWNAATDAVATTLTYRVSYRLANSPAPPPDALVEGVAAPSPVDVGTALTLRLDGLLSCRLHAFEVTAVDGVGNRSVPAGLSVRTLCGADGSFVEGQPIVEAGREWSFVATGDFNEDGITDFVAGDLTFPGSGVVEWNVFLGNGTDGRGDGTFAASTTGAFPVAATAETAHVAVGDFDSDDITDLVFGAGAAIVVRSGNGSAGRGDGTFPEGVVIPTLFAPVGHVAGLDVRDANRDGILDLIVPTRLDSTVVGFWRGAGSDGQGTGSFGAPVAVAVLAAQARSFVRADFNRDGAADYAVTLRGRTEVELLLGSTTGPGLSLPENQPRLLLGDFGRDLVAGDFDANGWIDLAVLGATGAVRVFLGDAPDPGDSIRFLRGPTLPADPGALAMGALDVNDDGALDLLTGGAAGGSLEILAGGISGGLPDGTFTPSFSIPSQFQVSALACADFNSDGVGDLLVLEPGVIRILLGQGVQGRSVLNFVAAGSQSAPVGGRLVGPVLAHDLDGDGVIDLAATSSVKNVGVTLFYAGLGSNGRGNGSFFAPTLTGGAGGPALVAGDFNHDGIGDLAVAGGSSVALLLHESVGARGTGAFTSMPESVPFASATIGGLAVADFEGEDGLVELVTSGRDLSRFQSTLSGPQSGGLSLVATILDDGDQRAALVAADWNADGIEDLAAINITRDRVDILLGQGADGNGTGAFVLSDSLQAGAGLEEIVAGDLNADGIMDLIVTASTDNVASVLLGLGSSGRGSGEFAPAVGYPVGTGPASCVLRDLDRDNILDLVVSNRDDTRIAVLRGNGVNGAGTATFAPATFVTVGANPRGVAVADFDTDGVLDLAVVVLGDLVETDDDRIRLFRGVNIDE